MNNLFLSSNFIDYSNAIKIIDKAIMSPISKNIKRLFSRDDSVDFFVFILKNL